MEGRKRVSNHFVPTQVGTTATVGEAFGSNPGRIPEDNPVSNCSTYATVLKLASSGAARSAAEQPRPCN